MTFEAIQGGYALSADDRMLVNRQKAITKRMNEAFIQVGAIFLKPASKNPIDEGWFDVTRGTTDLQAWIDDPAQQTLNVGFNLQFGWVDVDVDSPDPDFARTVFAAMDHIGIDTRFCFGRRSNGTPTHALLQLGEEEATNFEDLSRFRPNESTIGGKRYHVEIRSFPTDPKSFAAKARQTVMPGSVYADKQDATKYDPSVWFILGGHRFADNITEIAKTTPRIAPFNSIIRAVAFGMVAYIFRQHWIEGSRQATAHKLTGWLARVVADSQALNSHDGVSKDVWCPIDDHNIAVKLIEFICKQCSDPEDRMRVRAYHDAVSKLEANPDARIPGWSSVASLVGADGIAAMRACLTPGSDVSVLTRLADQYVYDKTTNNYIDKEGQTKQHEIFVHDGHKLLTRHKDDTVFIAGKPKEAFKIFEGSKLRKKADWADVYPEEIPGDMFRVNRTGRRVPDDDTTGLSVVYNLWQGWQVEPVHDIKSEIMEVCVQHIDTMFGYLTGNDPNQTEWLKKWIAWIRQKPATKQQIAPVIIGGQGVGKSFWGNDFMKSIFGPRLWGTASPKVVDDKFNIGPFKGKMFVFIDEAKFTGKDSVEEIKKLIRSTDIGGMEKFEEARNYRIFSRLAFASNTTKNNIAAFDAYDRALFYMRATDHKKLGCTMGEFMDWAHTLKPFYDSFARILEKEDHVAHMVRYFVDYPTDKYSVESIEHSSGNDPEIVEGSASWARKVAMSIIESGWVEDESTALTTAFTKERLAERVKQLCDQLGFKNVGPDVVMKELEMGGGIEYKAGFGHTKAMKAYSFRMKWGDIIEAFQHATRLRLSPYRDMNEQDYGPNDGSSQDRIGKARLGGAQHF